MSNYSTNCISGIPDPAALINITSCQTTANTPFCWPPNGTRLCVPLTSDVPFYWPTAYYNSTKSRVSISYDVRDAWLPNMKNDGNYSQLIHDNLYTYRAINVDGKKDEKYLAWYMRSRLESDFDPANVERHAGPTVILVKTASFTSTATSTSTASSKPNKGDDDDDDIDSLTGLTSGGMAGIIVGILVAIVGLVTACCWMGCCCCGPKQKRRPKFTMSKEEQLERVRLGTELMEQRGGGGGDIGKASGGKIGEREVRASDGGEARATEGPSRSDGAGAQGEITRVEAERARVDEEVVRDFIDPPPRYAP